jgi:hypothetical protein
MNAELINELLLASDSALDERKLQITIWVKILSRVILFPRLINATHEDLSRVLALRILDIAVSSELFI